MVRTLLFLKWNLFKYKLLTERKIFIDCISKDYNTQNCNKPLVSTVFKQNVQIPKISVLVLGNYEHKYFLRKLH